MGKGGCDVYDSGVGFIRGVLGCLCCLLCAGPILIIVGIVVLVSPNNFEANTNKYKDAIKTYDSNVRPLFTNASGSVDPYSGPNLALTVTSMTVPLTGVNADKLPTFSSSVLANSQVPVQTGSNPQLLGVRNTRMASNSGISFSASPVSFDSCQSQHTAQSSASCSDRDRRNNDCDYASSCRKTFGNGANTTSSSSSTCRWYESQQYFCRAVSLSSGSNNLWQQSQSKSTCDYIDGSDQAMGSYSENGGSTYRFTRNPLTIRGSSCSSSQWIPVYVRSDEDPYLVAAELTKGSFDFGLTAAQQRVLGLVLIIIGSLLVACIVGAIVMVKRRMSNDPRNGAAVYGAFGRTYQPQGGYQQMPPGTYGGVQYNEQGPQGYNQQPQGGYQQMPPQQQQQQQYGQPQQQQYGQPPQQQYGQPPQQQYGQPPGYQQQQQPYQQPQQHQQQPCAV